MSQHLDTLRTYGKKVAPFVVAAVSFFTAAPEAQSMMLHLWAIGSTVLTGWYMIAKANHRRWLAAASQREAEARERMRAVMSEWHAPKPEQQAADWFNWDGPYTVAGQRR